MTTPGNPIISPPPLSTNDRDDDREARDRALFERISASYARKDLAPASARARKQRLLRTLAAVPRSARAADPSSQDILEAGCGAGFSAVYLRGRYRTFHGIDYSANLIDYARQANAGPGVSFDAVNIKDFRPGKPFDLIFMIGVLHHMDDLHAGLTALVDLLKPGGWLLANEPQPANPVIRWLRAQRPKLDANYSAEQDQLTAAQMREAFERASLTNVRVRPQGLFSTPFAEVVLNPQWLTSPLSAAACAADTVLESALGRALQPLTWNLIAAGQKRA